MQTQVYLFFDGCCEEALEFYKTTLGAKVDMLMRFSESPEPLQPGTVTPENMDKVMHASLHIGDTAVMASDGHCAGATNFQGFALSIDAKDEAESERFFNALADGGHVQMPLAKTFWSPYFGMVTDKFGVLWMVTVPAEH